MSDVCIDIDQARRTVNELKHKREELTKAMQTLRNATNCEGWNDDNKRKFTSDVQDALGLLTVSRNKCEHLIGTLEDLIRKATSIKY